MSKETYFADIIVPVAVPNKYTYRIPFNWDNKVQIGQLVLVQFGRNKYHSAVVCRIHTLPPKKYEAKYIEAIIDERPLVNEYQLKLWDWITSYYICNPGDVMQAALPTGFKLSSETRLMLNTQDSDIENLEDESERILIAALKHNQSLDLDKVTQLLGIKMVHSLIRKMLDKKLILLEEEVKEKYKPRTENWIVLNKNYADETGMQSAFSLLKKAAKQEDLLLSFIQQTNWQPSEVPEIKKSVLMDKTSASPAVVKGLIDKGIFEEVQKSIGRIPAFDGKIVAIPELSKEQKNAKERIVENFSSGKNVTLLHGVTSSGKTEVYSELIQEELEKGKQVLYLVPEIALTTQLIQRLQRYFGDLAGVYHSKYSQNERTEVYLNLTFTERYKVILGARSSLFLPFNNLGLIIVDEEHETSYKQFERNPRYHARDAAIVLAKFHNANVLLGSATPSLEVFYNAKNGKYGYVELKKRFGNQVLPEIWCADEAEHKRKKLMKSHFTDLVIQQISQALSNQEQVIIFQNRRGYSPLWMCESCGWVPGCERCDISLTYHKYKHVLNCHLCGYTVQPPGQCEACGSKSLKMLGFGTEKIEEEIQTFFSKAKIARMDLDTTRSKDAFQNMINDLEDRKIDILVGTQMVTKGLDFENVGLVIVLSADQLLKYPDFRSYERAYQLLAQVSGRAGRSEKRGKVVIQTHQPNHWIIQKVITNDYEGMYNQEIIDRKTYHYPPFYRLINFDLSHREREKVQDASGLLAGLLREKLGKDLLGPEFPSIARVRNKYHMNILLKYSRTASLDKVREYINGKLSRYYASENSKGVHLQIDVDPL
ncbi:MAG: primosomal protein N' [Flavobacteriales bacterium]